MCHQPQVTWIALLICLSFIQSMTDNSSEPSVETLQNALIRKVDEHKVFGDASDPIAITELPGYTGWPRNRVDSKISQCFLTRLGNRIASLVGPMNTFQHEITNSANVWTVSIACPNVPVPPGRGLLPTPLYYARAYGPAILFGTQKTTTSITVQNGTNYTETDISFFIKDPGFYTVEVVLESIVTPDLHSLFTPTLYYEGFLLRGFPLILNVTSSNIQCATAKNCNMPLCASKDIESDFTSSSGRWIVLGHLSFEDNESRKGIPEKPYDRYTDGVSRLGIKTYYQPMKCGLAPMKSTFALLDACVKDAGLHFIFIGDSVSNQHFLFIKGHLNNPRYRFSFHSLYGIDKSFNKVSEELLRIKKENSSKPKVLVLNAGLHEIVFCKPPLNVSCAEHYRQGIKTVLDFVVLNFPSDLKIFRTTNAAWMRWGNFGFVWDPSKYQNMNGIHYEARFFNDIALQVIRDSGYDVKVYDLFSMTVSRPDDTEINPSNEAGAHMVHLGHDTLKASVRKMMTIVADYFGCWI